MFISLKHYHHLSILVPPLFDCRANEILIKYLCALGLQDKPNKEITLFTFYFLAL